MICEKCKTKNENGTAFCKNCGTKLNEGDKKENMASKEVLNKRLDILKRLPRKLQLGLAAVVVVLLFGLFIGNSKPTINLNDYLIVEATGYNGYGKLNSKIDWDKFYEKYEKKLKLTKEGEKYIDEFGVLEFSAMEIIEYRAYASFDKYENLSNGEEIPYAWNEELNEVEKYVKCNLKFEDDIYKVSGLEEVEKFDAFADLTVTFKGTDPYGNVLYEYDGEELDKLDFYISNSTELSNGDVITIEIQEATVLDCLKELGKIPMEASREYTVEGLEHFVMSDDDISEEMLTKMQEQAEDEFASYSEKSWDKDETSLVDFSYLGNYFLVEKEPDYNSYQYGRGMRNGLYLVYEVTVRNQYSDRGDSYDEETTYYWTILYRDLIIDAEGDLVKDLTHNLPYSQMFTVNSGVAGDWGLEKRWQFTGFENLSDLYGYIVTANVNLYNCEENME